MIHLRAIPPAEHWDADRTDRLKALWTEGLSAAKISRALGGVTRNAVIGKAHRLVKLGELSPRGNLGTASRRCGGAIVGSLPR